MLQKDLTISSYYFVILELIYQDEVENLMFKLDKFISEKDVYFNNIESKQEYTLKDLEKYLSNVSYDTIQKRFKRDENLQVFKKTGKRYLIPKKFLFFSLCLFTSKSQNLKLKFDKNLKILNEEEFREFVIRAIAKNSERDLIYNQLKKLFDIFYPSKKNDYENFKLTSSRKGVEGNFNYLERLITDTFIYSTPFYSNIKVGVKYFNRVRDLLLKLKFIQNGHL